MNKIILLGGLVLSSFAFASSRDFSHTETIKCGKDGCSVTCHEPGNRWNSFLQSKGNIEVTYFHQSGTRQLKASMGNGEYTILETNPAFQSCRISGVVD
ncbi:MAG: hypothetical protein L3J83_01205 [Proteobacteria bacterium]|nr:hypothetical protein [Pseudomonadota bacterium]